MSDGTPFYITTPIYYVNDAPHIGHAYTTVACDVLARSKRLDGYDVRFLTGTDEHGQKVEKAAEAAGEAPQPFTDRMSGNFRDLAETLRTSNDIFMRTTEHRHKLASQGIWNALVAAGDIYLGSYAGWYSVRDEASRSAVTAPGSRRPAPSASGSRSPAISSGSRNGRTACWPSTRPIRTSSGRKAGVTRSSVSSAAACRTCRFRARRSIGASRSPETTPMSCMSGWMR